MVVFPEAVRTNGKGVLQWQPLFRTHTQGAEAVRTHLVTFKFSSRVYPPAQPVDGLATMVAKLAFQLSTYAACTLLFQPFD